MGPKGFARAVTAELLPQAHYGVWSPQPSKERFLCDQPHTNCKSAIMRETYPPTLFFHTCYFAVLKAWVDVARTREWPGTRQRLCIVGVRSSENPLCDVMEELWLRKGPPERNLERQIDSVDWKHAQGLLMMAPLPIFSLQRGFNSTNLRFCKNDTK